jgi:hypothetical protein
MQTHLFHIPVMGTGFTIDTPLKVARYGIDSVMSLVDDNLIEEMRKFYSRAAGEACEPIADGVKNARAARITAYLDLVDRLVARQVSDLKNQAFDGESDLCVFFELLDDASPIKQAYHSCLEAAAGPERSEQERLLRECVRAGATDVNIMTKADRQNRFGGEVLPREDSDAMAALRGFALSTLSGSVVFSAGLNPYLYSYVGEFEGFYPQDGQAPKKKVVLKVSDFRSASIQAKTLAKKGVWVWEYRIESGLNCGGHAFATQGHLLGPILEEFRTRKAELVASLFPLYQAAAAKANRTVPAEPYPVRITAQGGIGTSEEHRLLMSRFEVDSVGWGSPFLLVPEVTAVDASTLAILASSEKEVYLSRSSPLGVPYYNLRGSGSEALRLARIADGKPGSPCVNKNLAMNTDYGEALCVASSRYQRLKLEELRAQEISDEERRLRTEAVLEKACICRELGDGAMIKYGLRDRKKTLAPAICPGPNIAYFSRICTLKEMVGHIYGRGNVLDPSCQRPHVFVNELRLYVDHLKEQVERAGADADALSKEADSRNEFRENLLGGIEFYRESAGDFFEADGPECRKFLADLDELAERLDVLASPAAASLSGPR